MIIGYCRVSRKEQSIERQIRNILNAYPEAVIAQEKYTGTDISKLEKLTHIFKTARKGDTIIFDSVSRMSREAKGGIAFYEIMRDRGIELVFLKEPHINTETYRKALESEIQLTGNEIADVYIKATNEVLKILARKQIELAFEQSEKEVKDLQQRTREGIETAKRAGKQIGAVEGKKLITKKSIEMKAKIKKLLENHKDVEIMELTGLARNTYYKYKKEIAAE